MPLNWRYPAIGLSTLCKYHDSGILDRKCYLHECLIELNSMVLYYTIFTKGAYMPPLLYHVGFSFAFGAAWYAIHSRNVRNGSGIATGISSYILLAILYWDVFLNIAWSSAFLFLHLWNSLKSPQNPLALVMVGGAIVCVGTYGADYFILQA